MENEVLPPEKKGYCLRNPPTINYNDGRDNWRSMHWNKLIVGYHYIHNVTKDYVNVLNAIATFVYPTTSTSIITNETIPTQHSIKQGLKVFVKKGEDIVRK